MSDVFSFRLNRENKREVLAIQVLQIWMSKGFTLRQIMTEALLKLDTHDDLSTNSQIIELFRKMEEIYTHLRIMDKAEYIMENKTRESPETGLSPQLIETIKMSIKPGIRRSD